MPQQMFSGQDKIRGSRLTAVADLLLPIVCTSPYAVNLVCRCDAFGICRALQKPFYFQNINYNFNHGICTEK